MYRLMMVSVGPEVCHRGWQDVRIHLLNGLNGSSHFF